MNEGIKLTLYIALLILNLFSLIILISPSPKKRGKKPIKPFSIIGELKERNFLFNVITCYMIPFLSLFCFFAIINFSNGFNIELLLGNLKNTLKSLAFEIEFCGGYSLNSIFEINSAFKLIQMLAFLVIYLVSLFIFYYSIITGLFKSLKNVISLHKALNKSCDILIGIDNIEMYAKEARNIIVWLLPSSTKADIDLLRGLAIPYIKKEFNFNELYNLSLKYNKNEYNFISFNNDEDNLIYISEFIKYLELENSTNKKIYEYHNLYIHTEISIDNLVTIHDKILANSKELSPYINIFNRYELTALKFINDSPLAKFIPNEFISDSIILDTNSTNNKIKLNNCDDDVLCQYDKMLNVIYLGFGRVNSELFKSQAINDQLVSFNPSNNTIKSHIVNYFAFDNKAHDKKDKNEQFYSKRYDLFKEKILNKELDKNDYLEMPEDVYRLYRIREDVNDKSNIENILSLLKIKDSYNQIIISLENDLDNIDLALKLIMLFNENDLENYHIFVRIKNDNEKTIELIKNNDKIDFFGCDSHILNSDVIINKQIISFAKLMNKKYNQKRLSDTSWYSLSPIKQKSNIYAGLSIRSKLNLLEADYTNDINAIENKECLKKLEYSFNSYHEFRYDNGINTAKLLSYQEKLRWNAFYIMNGYIPYKKSDIKYDIFIPTELSFIKDNDRKRSHACLTSANGLDEYHNIFKNIVMYEKYDYVITENEKINELKSYKKFIEFNSLINNEINNPMAEFVKLNNDILKYSLQGIDKSFNSIHSKFIYYLITNKIEEINEIKLANALLNYFQVYKYDYSLLDNLNIIFDGNSNLRIINK